MAAWAVLFFVTVLSIAKADNSSYPLVGIRAFKPNGLRVNILDDLHLTTLAFEGGIRKNGSKTSNPSIKGLGFVTLEGNWVFEDTNVSLAEGDELFYRIFMTREAGTIGSGGPLTEYRLRGFVTDIRWFTVLELEENFSLSRKCQRSDTKVLGRKVCSGQTIFLDDFSSPNLREDLWQIEHYIPADHPDHPFVSYQRQQTNRTVWVKNGKLYIKPRLQRDMPGFTDEDISSGTLNLIAGLKVARVGTHRIHDASNLALMGSNALVIDFEYNGGSIYSDSSGCTRHQCIKHTVGDILPPVASGRVTSARFAFTYGIITVRAKLPQGDWLYPELLLEPMAKKYGALDYASGLLMVAIALGNKDLNKKHYTNEALKGGPILNAKCPEAMDFYRKRLFGGELWGDDFHNYTLTWTPDSIELAVDGEQFGRYMHGATGLRAWLPRPCRGDWYANLGTGGPMAPFDDYFYITLGVAAGGIMRFPDTYTTNNGPKPWRNKSAKAMLNFWKDVHNWYPTWTNSTLIIDSVKVVAL